MTNARFWIMHRDSWVKLTLRPGQSLHTFSGGPTDEGWSSFAEQWQHVGGAILRHTVNDGRDCDGRLTQHFECTCALENLRSRDCGLDDAPDLLPDWQRVSASQCDEFAEAMGF